MKPRNWNHQFWMVGDFNIAKCRSWLKENVQHGYRLTLPLASGYRTAWVLLDRDRDAVLFKMVWQPHIHRYINTHKPREIT